MSELTAAEKTKLNDFHKSQPALTYSGHMANNYPVGIELGTKLEKALSSGVVKATWDFDVHGGAITPDIDLGAILTSGAVITHIYSSVLTTVTSAGVCKFDLKAGSTVLASITDATLATGVQSLTVTLGVLAADSKVYLNIDTTAATAGKVDFYIQYMNP